MIAVYLIILLVLVGFIALSAMVWLAEHPSGQKNKNTKK